MLTICIPIFEQDVSTLVHELHRQISASDTDTEIVLIDDHSPGSFDQKNRELEQVAKYDRLPENIGRAAIRNLFLKHTQASHLLFLDGDSVIIKADFLKKYIQAISIGKYDVICGGRTYPDQAPHRKFRLNWLYGKKTESRPAELRQQDPYRSFMTNNFVIRRSILERIPFDERVKGYGHEDTLFGLGLKKFRVPILHLDNPVSHGQLSTNREFMRKTGQAISNLVRIRYILQEDPELMKEIRLLQTVEGLRKKGMNKWVRRLFGLLKPILTALLSSGFMGLNAFQFHKLGLYLEMEKARMR
jgi:glycosyltransferase involved in cell wall biosynthesis